MESSAAADRLVVVATHWTDGPSVRLRRIGEATSELRPLVGLQLNYQASPESPRHCLGHTPFRQGSGDYVDCLNVPEPGGRKCTACTIVDATFASNLHHAHTRGQAELDPAIVEHLRQPNVLYLAAFRDGSMKVGTSTQRRTQNRLAEQGAWRAMLVATSTDGYAIREIEDKVTADLGIAQSVSINRKLAGMARPRADGTLESDLEERSGEVAAVLEAMEDGRLARVLEAWSFPGSDGSVWSDLHRYPLKLDSGSHDIEIVAACGRAVVLKRPGSDDRFVADIGALYGVELRIGDFASDELAVQDALF